MSIEVVRLTDHRIYLIVGDPEHGYDIHRTDDRVIAHYPHKFEARHAINHGQLAEPIFDEAATGREPAAPSKDATAVASQPGGRRTDGRTAPSTTTTANQRGRQ